MRASMALGLAMTVGIAVGGCSMTGGGSQVVASVPPVPAAPPPITYGAFLDGPVGMKLSQTDRDKARVAEEQALAAGQRRSWRGEKGTFGYVEPAAGSSAAVVPAADQDAPPPPVAADVCKPFTSTIFLGGHPQVGHGTGCQNPDGSYHVAS